MPNLDALDTLIAIVVVLLILSLLVQSIQSLIKKLFKLKSKEIEKSLLILFENIIEKNERPKQAAAPATPATPAAATPDEPVTSRQLVEQVLEKFKATGRTTKWERPVLESISKEDLLKVLARVKSSAFYSGYIEKFAGLYKQVEDLEQKINALVSGGFLQGAASAKIAEMREVLSPLINDFKAIVSGGTVKRNVLLGDLLALREIKLSDALALLSSAQESVAKDLEAERAAKNDVAVAALQELSKRLTEIAGVIGQLGQRADEAFGTLRTQLDHVGNWYDTVMQSFEERYNRHMKNFSIYISIGVVIFFNANIFRIYRNISTDELQRTLILKAGEKYIDERRSATTNANANTNASRNTNANANAAQGNGNAATAPEANAGVGNSNAAADDNSNNAASNLNGNTAATGNTSNANSAGNANRSNSNAANSNANAARAPANKLPPDVAELDKDLEVIKDYGAKYRSLGFAPLTMDQLGNWWDNFWKPKNKAQWWIDRLVDLKRLLGWALTVLLLSVGAPFWQDTLESLFGVKNLLRKKSNTRNVETSSGEGQPRS